MQLVFIALHPRPGFQRAPEEPDSTIWEWWGENLVPHTQCRWSAISTMGFMPLPRALQSRQVPG